MAHNYIPVNRDQPFLIAPDMREWLGSDHLVWFVLDCVDGFDTSALHDQHPKGVGRAAYDPDVLLALIIYGYCTGIRSSRQIERLCEVDVAYRVIMGNKKPDHSTIARFRKEFTEISSTLFCNVLEVAKSQGSFNLGVVALDGTKMAASASNKKNRNREQLESIVKEMFDEAEAIDAHEDKLYGDHRGDELPESLTDPEKRKAAIDRVAKNAKAAKGKLDEREQNTSAGIAGQKLQRAKERERECEKRVEQARLQDERRRQEIKPGRKVPPDGSKIFKRAQETLETSQRMKARWQARFEEEQKANTANITDCDSRRMKSHKGWVQGYNAQAIVDANGIIIAADIWDNPNDLGAFLPMMHKCLDNLILAGIDESVGIFLADAGYFSEDNVTTKGPDRLIADTRAYKIKRETKDDLRHSAKTAEVLNQHRERLRSPEGKELYSKRQHMIEPVFGHTKFNRGFTNFLLRGMQAVKGEWNLMMMAHNLTKLHTAKVKG